MMVGSVRIVIPGEPVAKGRPRFGAGLRPYTPAKTRQAEGIASSAARVAMAGRDVFAGPIRVHILAVFPVAKSWPKSRREDALNGKIHVTKKPDIDNVAKLVTDAMNGIVWIDDSQIVELEAAKVYGENPRTIVSVNPVDVLRYGRE